MLFVRTRVRRPLVPSLGMVSVRQLGNRRKHYLGWHMGPMIVPECLAQHPLKPNEQFKFCLESRPPLSEPVFGNVLVLMEPDCTGVVYVRFGVVLARGGGLGGR